MKKYFGLFFIFSLMFAVFSTQAFTEEAKPAPDFTLPDLNNKPFTLSSYKGKQSVIMLFWTTWCPFCREELKVINRMSEELKNEKVEVLAINIGEPLAKVSKFIEPYNLTFPVLLDQAGSVARSYGVFGVPTYVIVNDKGSIRLQENYFPKDDYKKIIRN
ncbi:MAG: TlpA family protein disulfide reductase [Candidatus Omnitrophica bacterium]|nr:TlpA family protein disulfide reductase [Candidatus Omnitrophota bacterium]MBU1928420.1 TlpA family protein disulfide reductase [Candidatus Omnitrophota bacterium]MBU2034302.1 TlpA family protein disulfide reductase [Candidatus Omnitrophota bacterium]